MIGNRLASLGYVGTVKHIISECCKRSTKLGMTWWEGDPLRIVQEIKI